MRFTDYYEVLGVKPDASEAEIKAAYRRLARKFHPDVSKETDAEARFKAVNEANEVLSDAKKRAHYDRLRAGGYHAGEEFRPPPDFGEGVQFEFGEGGAGGFSDFFESLFGARARAGRPGTGPRPRARPQAQRARIELDLETVFAGGSRRIELDGRTLEVKIPAGIGAGQSIRLGGQGSGGGDLLLEIAYAPHPKYELEGRDVVHRLVLAPWEAALGADVQVPTLGGEVSLRVPPGSDRGRRLRLRGRGLPGNPAGDQYVVIEVRAPTPESEVQRAAYRTLAQAFGRRIEA